MKKTISQVAPEPRIWEGGQYGPLAFIKVTFDDESQGDVACKPDNTENVIGILNGLKGKESDFQLEAKDDYQDIKQFKITGYPGKPGQQSGGSGGVGGGQRPSGSRHDPQTNASIEAQVAAKIAGEVVSAAIQYSGGAAPSDPVKWMVKAIPEIAAAIRLAANGSQESGPTSPPSPPGGPLPSSGPDEAEGGTPGVSPSGPDSVTTPQLTKLAIMFKEQDIPAEERHEYVSQFLGRDITSFKQLTKTEASQLIEAWSSEPEANAPDLAR